MHKYIVLAFVGLGQATLTAQTDAEILDARFNSAIEKLDVAKIENLLARVGTLEPAYKKILQDDAQYGITAAQIIVSLSKSEKDRSALIKWGLGVCASGGLMVLAARIARPDDSPSRLPGDTDRPGWNEWHALSAVFFGGAFFSGYFALHGFRCSYATGRLASARKIAKLIGRAPVKVID